jgi:hypothetical protein
MIDIYACEREKLVYNKESLTAVSLGDSAGILEQFMWARNRVGIGLQYRAVRLHRLTESTPGLLQRLKVPSLDGGGGGGGGVRMNFRVTVLRSKV